MKVIISHDVDHLSTAEHWTKDLIHEKFIVRSFLKWFKGQISFSVCIQRIGSVFKQRMCRIPEIMEYDKQHHVPSVFFFGMDNGYGLSYSQKRAEPWIKAVIENGFDAGVHTIEIENLSKIEKEYDDFHTHSRLNAFGTRIHYVRYDHTTFEKLAKAGYQFDTSEFNKETVWLKQPYKIGEMWEFPLHIMEGYILKKNNLEYAKQITIETIDKAVSENSKYLTLLFHDSYFDERLYPTEYAYYTWFIDYCQQQGFSFISYTDAIEELNGR